MLHIKEIKPRHTTIVTTGEKYSEDMRENGIITAKKGDLKLYQKVIAMGEAVRHLEIGDTVMINPARFIRRKYSKNSVQNDMDNNPIISIEFEWVMLDDKEGNTQECLLLDDTDIKFAFVGEEKNESIIMPDKPKIITS